jgi:hypothetical protein
MSRIKTKRILWTIAVLVVLSFVLAIVLHKPDKPKITGNFSPADISAISKATLKSDRNSLKQGMRWHLKHKKIMSLIRDVTDYAFSKVSSIEAQPGGTIHVMVRPKSGRGWSGYYLSNKESKWKIVGLDMIDQPSRD